jgi:hypothetical protein
VFFAKFLTVGFGISPNLLSFFFIAVTKNSVICVLGTGILPSTLPCILVATSFVAYDHIFCNRYKKKRSRAFLLMINSVKLPPVGIFTLP